VRILSNAALSFRDAANERRRAITAPEMPIISAACRQFW